jgi:VanZ family protein
MLRAAGINLTRKYYGLLSVLIVFGYYLAGLWPFNFFPKNKVEWLGDRPGLHFSRHGAVYSSRPLRIGDHASLPAGALSLELLLRPDVEPSGGIGSIFVLYDGTLPENILIGQWRSGILIRSASWNSRGIRRYHETGVDGVFWLGRARLYAITSGAAGTVFYVDGVPVKSSPRYFIHPSLLGGQVLLGNSPEGGETWAGSVLGLAIFDRPLGAGEIVEHQSLWDAGNARQLLADPSLSALYLFTEGAGRTAADSSRTGADLVLPETFHPIRKTILVPPWEERLMDLSHAEDIAVNILGFVPFGWCFFLACGGAGSERAVRVALLVIFVGAVISLSIELVQVYLPTRSSSLTDVICNILGTALGVLLVTSRFFQPSESSG